MSASRTAWRTAYPASMPVTRERRAVLPTTVTRLIGDRVLHPSMAVSRPNKGASYSPTGVITMAENDAPRWSRQGRLIVEGYKVNNVANPRGVGASEGVFPTGWIYQATGDVARPVGVGIEDGIPYFEIRFVPAGSRNDQNILFIPHGAQMAAKNDPFSFSFFCRRVAGSPAGFSNLRMRYREATSGGGFVADRWQDLPAADISEGPLRDNRLSFQQILQGDTTGSIQVGFRMDSTAAGDMTLRIGAPNLTQYGVLNTPIWPDEGVIAQTSRNTDQIAGVIAPEQGSLGGAFQVAFPGQWDGWGVLQIDDGTNDNRIVLAVGPDDSSLRVTVVRAGVEAFVGVLGAISLDVRTPLALAWGAEGVRARMAGQPEVVWTGTVPAGLTNLRPGHGSATWNRPLYGGIGPLDHYDRPVDTARILEAVG